MPFVRAAVVVTPCVTICFCCCVGIQRDEFEVDPQRFVNIEKIIALTFLVCFAFGCAVTVCSSLCLTVVVIVFVCCPAWFEACILQRATRPDPAMSRSFRRSLYTDLATAPQSAWAMANPSRLHKNDLTAAVCVVVCTIISFCYAVFSSNYVEPCVRFCAHQFVWCVLSSCCFTCLRMSFA